jgi:hypothetical protein
MRCAREYLDALLRVLLAVGPARLVRRAEGLNHRHHFLTVAVADDEPAGFLLRDARNRDRFFQFDEVAIPEPRRERRREVNEERGVKSAPEVGLL